MNLKYALSGVSSIYRVSLTIKSNIVIEMRKKSPEFSPSALPNV